MGEENSDRGRKEQDVEWISGSLLFYLAIYAYIRKA